MPFNVGGLQYFGKLEITQSGGGFASATLTEIYNNTGQTFGTSGIGSQYAFGIQASVGWSGYDYSVTFTPINLVQASQSLIPYYLNQAITSPSILAISMSDWEGNDFFPNNVGNAISYYINIRLT
jgi:hypothetical protein